MRSRQLLLLLTQLLLQFLHAFEQQLHRNALLATRAFGAFTRLRARPIRTDFSPCSGAPGCCADTASLKVSTATADFPPILTTAECAKPTVNDM